MIDRRVEPDRRQIPREDEDRRTAEVVGWLLARHERATCSACPTDTHKGARREPHH